MNRKKLKQETPLDQIAQNLLLRMLLALVLYTVLGVFVYLSAIFIYRLFVWHGDEVVYILVHWLDIYKAAIALMYVAIGYAFIFYHFWKRPFLFLDEILSATENIYKHDEAFIEFSAPLKQVELQMNQLKMTMQNNERIAKEAEQRKNDLVMYLAHDIKTPLTSMMGYLSLLDETPDIPAEQKARFIRITLDKAYRLEQLIDEFFEITRYNFHTITLARKSIDLYYLLVQLVDEFYPLLAASGKQAVIHAPEDLTVYGDADKLARVFNNILKNAIAYGGAQSVIDITAARSGDKVSVIFRNTGSIPQDKLASIFEKFYRLDDARSSGQGGAGLGLAIAKEIVVLHGGQIYAESQDAYTTFRVELPAH